MKQFIKKNKITILSIIILIVWSVYEIINCYNEGLISNDPLILYYHIVKDLSLSFIQILAPLFVFIPAIWNFHNELSSGYIKNSLTRIEYKKYLIKNYFNALLKTLILPCFVIFLFLMCCLLTKGFDFGSGKEMYGWIASPEQRFLNNLPIFMMVYIINILFHSILYVNLGFLYCKKYSNILVNILLSYLSFIILDIFMEIFLGNLILAKLLNIHNMSYSLNLFNIWIYDKVISFQFTIIYSVTLVIISTILIYFKYKNKEDVIIEIEK